MFGPRLGFLGSADRMALFPLATDSNEGGVGKTWDFSRFMRQYFENGTRYDQSY